MDCCSVFAVLTRAPFPTGGLIDGPVEQHLAHCPSCAGIAEALRPAPELFHESLAPGEARDLPGYWGGAPATLPTRSERRGRRVHTLVAAPLPPPMVARGACRSVAIPLGRHVPLMPRVRAGWRDASAAATLGAALLLGLAGLGWWAL